MSNWICTWFATCILCLIQPFIVLWLGKDYLLDFYSVIFLVLFFYSNGIRQFYSTVYVGAKGYWNKTLFRQILSCVSNLFLNIILVQKYGIKGIVFSSFITNLAISCPLDIKLVYTKIIQKNVIDACKAVSKDFTIFFMTAVITLFICVTIKENSLCLFAVRLFICAIIPNLILFAIYRNTHEFIYIRERALKVLNKIKSNH